MAECSNEQCPIGFIIPPSCWRTFRKRNLQVNFAVKKGRKKILDHLFSGKLHGSQSINVRRAAHCHTRRETCRLHSLLPPFDRTNLHRKRKERIGQLFFGQPIGRRKADLQAQKFQYINSPYTSDITNSH